MNSSFCPGSFGSKPRRQRGLALAVAMVFLLVMTLIGLVAMQSSTVQSILARNTQFEIEATQKAQAIIDAILANDNNFSLELRPGERNCYPDNVPGNGIACDDSFLKTTLENLIIPTGTYAEVRRLRPAQVPPPAPAVTSMDKFTSAAFAVRGKYNRAEIGLGAADIEQGIIKIVPTSARIE